MEKTVTVDDDRAAASQGAPTGAAPGQVASIVDCRDQLCPKPILMVKRALSDAALSQTLEVIVNEHVSKENVLKYCWNHGQEVFRSYEDGPDFHIFVKKSPEVKVEKPMPVIGPCGARWD
ncbi:MAG: sulfurtransferase TusA family protein [Nitrososphaerales archaeon]|jgi:TusA-related sulfurtransferase